MKISIIQTLTHVGTETIKKDILMTTYMYSLYRLKQLNLEMNVKFNHLYKTDNG